MTKAPPCRNRTCRCASEMGVDIRSASTPPAFALRGPGGRRRIRKEAFGSRRELPMLFEGQILVDAPLDQPAQTGSHQFRPQTHRIPLAAALA
jgi:hypothetical protein